MGYAAGGGTWADAASNYYVAICNNAMDVALNGALYNMAMGYKELEIYQKEEQVNTLFKKYKKEKPKTFTNTFCWS